MLFIHAQHRGKVDTDKAKTQMFTKTIDPTNEEEAQKWWQENTDEGG
jgi:hypothetical protein